MINDNVRTFKVANLVAQSSIHKLLYPQYVELKRKQLQAHANLGMCNIPESKDQLKFYHDIACAEVRGFTQAFEKALEAVGGVETMNMVRGLDRPKEWIALEEKDVCGSSVGNKVVFLKDRRLS